MKMEEQEMRRSAASAALQAVPTASNRPRTAGTRFSGAAGAFRASERACSPRMRGGSTHKADETAASGTNAAAQAPASRWRELRKSVRIKATRETASLQPSAGRIADLCEEDREKVAKLVRRLVEVASRHEEVEKKLTSERCESEKQLQQVREQATRDTQELEELRDALQAARRKAKRLEKRVRRMEVATDAETRRRLDAEQALEHMKREAHEVHALVHDQREEIQREAERKQREGEAELKRVSEQLRETHELLLQERQELLLQEKQKELQQRLEGSTGVTGGARGVSAVEEAARPRVDVSSFLNTSCELPEKMQEILDGWKQRVEDALTDAAAKGASNQTQAVKGETTVTNRSASVTSVACQTTGSDVEERVQAVQTGNGSEHEEKVSMDDGEQKLSNLGAPESVEASRTPCEVEEGFMTPVGSRQRRLLRQQGVPKVKRLNFDQFISALGSDSDGSTTSNVVAVGGEENREVVHEREDVQGRDPRPESHVTSEGPGFQAVQTSFASKSSLQDARNDGFERRKRRTELVTSRVSDESLGDLYESSLFDVVEAVERTQNTTSRSSVDEFQLEEKAPRFSDGIQLSRRRPTAMDSPSTRVEGLRKQLEARERVLYGPNGAVPRPTQSMETLHVQDGAFGAEWDDLAAFEEVKELYAEDLFASRRWEPSTSIGREAGAGDPPLLPGGVQRDADKRERDSDAPARALLSTQELSVREAVERDLEELLRSEGLRSLASAQQ